MSTWKFLSFIFLFNGLILMLLFPQNVFIGLPLVLYGLFCSLFLK